MSLGVGGLRCSVVELDLPDQVWWVSSFMKATGEEVCVFLKGLLVRRSSQDPDQFSLDYSTECRSGVGGVEMQVLEPVCCFEMWADVEFACILEPVTCQVKESDFRCGYLVCECCGMS